jgi:uncharacterized membrane protein YagU involved in acid resistance
MDVKKDKAAIIIWLCFLTGTLDAIAAILIGYKVSPVIVFQYIASGWFGPAAFEGGTKMVILGLVFHYIIASSYSIVFFLSYPFFARIFRNKYLVAFVFGLIIWLVMNLVVLPLTNVPGRPARANVVLITEALAALFLCLGLPISLVANRYFLRQFLAKTLDRL